MLFEKEIILREQLAARCLLQCSPARKLPANAGTLDYLKVCPGGIDYLLKADMRGVIGVGERIGDYALTEIRRFQIAEVPPSTYNSTPFTKLDSSEARNSATVAISSGPPIFPRGIRDSKYRFVSSSKSCS